MTASRLEARGLARVLDGIVLCILAAPAVGSACSSSESSPSASGGSAGADASVEANAADAGDGCTPYVADVEIIVFPDGNGACHAHHVHPCGLPQGVELADGCVFRLNDCLELCPASGGFECYGGQGACVDGSLAPDATMVTCDFCSTNVGRRPRGLRRGRTPKSSSALGDYFARIAHLEAASVFAFDDLGRDLAALGAPKRLLSAIARAERDEKRHARMTAALARRYGARANAPSVRPRKPSSIARLSLQNAVEGCVRETFGALVATWQARHANDPKLARTFGAIARDETRHAALAWQIRRFTDLRLSASERASVRRAMSRALAELQSEIAEPHRDLVIDAGVPTRAVQRALFERLENELWADALLGHI